MSPEEGSRPNDEVGSARLRRTGRWGGSKVRGKESRPFFKCALDLDEIGLFATHRGGAVVDVASSREIVLGDEQTEGALDGRFYHLVQGTAGSLGGVDLYQSWCVLGAGLGKRDHDDLTWIGDVEQRQHLVRRTKPCLVKPSSAKILVGLTLPQSPPEDCNCDHCYRLLDCSFRR